MRIGRPPKPAPTPGTKLGHLTVVREVRKEMRKGGYERGLLVECDCENKTQKVITFSAFGRTLSCGCVRITEELESEAPVKAVEKLPVSGSGSGKRVDADGRTCTGVCGRYRPWSDYYPSKKGGHEAECKECMSLRRKRPNRFKIDDWGRECTSPKCGYAYQPWSNFNKGNAARNRSSWCKDCLASYNSERTPEAEMRHQELLKKLELFSISFESYQGMFEEYEGKCHRCNQEEPIRGIGGVPRPLIVDWDREHCNFEPTRDKPLCGTCVRGLVCSSCVYILEDINKHGLASLLAYLQKPPSRFLPSSSPLVQSKATKEAGTATVDLADLETDEETIQDFEDGEVFPSNDDSPIDVSPINPDLLRWADVT